MKTPGIIKDPLFYLRILTVCTVLSTASLIFRTADNTSVENTFGKNESLDLRWTVKDQGELQVKVTGASTTVVVQKPKEDLKRFGKTTFKREILSLHPTAGKVNYEETRQLFVNNVLVEALTDGTPAYYNSNILGRYYRKDYFDFGNATGTDAS